MNKYLVINFEDNTIISTNDLNNIVKDLYDRYGSSISCIDKEDLLKELEEIIKEEKENK